MGMITKHKSSGRVEVRFSGDELLSEAVVAREQAQFKVGSLISFVAEQKLKARQIDVPPGAVKVSFDKKSGEFIVLFLQLNDYGE